MYFVNGADKAEARLLSPPVLAAALYLCHVFVSLSGDQNTMCKSSRPRICPAGTRWSRSVTQNQRKPVTDIRPERRRVSSLYAQV